MSTPNPTIDLGYPTEGSGPIPSFSSVEEESEWWDTHDADGNVIDAEESEDDLTLFLNEAEFSALTKYAKRKGIGPSTLARIWIKEHLAEEAARDAKAS